MSAASEQLAAWAAASITRPGELPPGVEPVRGRLVRVVGRGDLEGVGPVYLKAMGFPRAKDRLRYAFRALPATHEALLLRTLAAAGIACPEVVDVRAVRRRGLPWSSLLVTRALDVEPDPDATGGVPFVERTRVAFELARIGLFHPDLNRENIVRLRDGRAAVLDLQSARLSRAPLRGTRRRRMAAKLLFECGAENHGAVLVTEGLIEAAERAGVELLASRLQREAFERRVRRCFRESTEFTVERRWNGSLHRLRSESSTGSWVDGDRELVRLWVGQRIRQVVAGRPLIIARLFKKSWWLPGPYRVYIPGVDAEATLADHRDELRDAERSFREGRVVLDRR